MLGKAVSVLLAVTLCSLAFAVASAPARYYQDSKFCNPGKAYREYGFAKLPPIRELPAGGRLPFAPAGVGITGYFGGHVVTQQTDFGFAVRDEMFERNFRLDWTVSAQMWLLGGQGKPLGEVGSTTLRIGQLDPEQGARLGVETLAKRAFYRLDVQFADAAGAQLGSYSAYVRLARPFWKAELRLDRRAYGPGQQVVIRLENLGTESFSYGEEFGVQRREGGSWVTDPKLTPDVWADLLNSSGPGASDCGAVRLPRNTAAGRYRIVKGVTEEVGPRRSRLHRLTAPFTVR